MNERVDAANGKIPDDWPNDDAVPETTPQPGPTS